MTEQHTPEELDAFMADLFKVTQTDLANRPRFKPYTWDETEASGDLGWLVGDDEHPVLLAMALWCVYGLYKSGKTYYAFEVAFCIAFGLKFNGLPTAHGDIVYLIAEGGVKRMRKRFEALYAKYEDQLKGKFPTAKDAFDAGHFNMVPHAVNLADFNAPGGVDELLSHIDTTKTYLACFLDTWALMLAASGGSDTDDKTVMPAIFGCKRIQATLGCSVAIVAHVGYGQNAQDRPKGLSDLPGALDGGTLAQKEENSGAETFKFTSMIQRHAINGYVSYAGLEKHGPNLALSFKISEDVKKSKLKKDHRTALDLLVQAGNSITLEAWRVKAIEANLFQPNPDKPPQDPTGAWRSAWKACKRKLIDADLIHIEGDVARVKDKAADDAAADFSEPNFGH